MTSKLRLDPDTSSYSAVLGAEMLSAQVQFGHAVRRRDFIGAPAVLQIQWVLDIDQYNYLWAFYVLTIDHGTSPFVMDLILDDSDIAEYQCKFMPGTLSLSGKSGDAYVVAATLEVTPSPADLEGDAGFVAIFGEYGAGAGALLDALDHLVNVDLPGSLG